MHLVMIGLAVASAIAAALQATPAFAQPSGANRLENPNPPARGQNAKALHQLKGDAPDHPASDLATRTAVPPDLDQRRRDGHMTPEERRLLRQHIEDAVRELYKR